MTRSRLLRRFPPDVEAEFRQTRITGLAEVNANTFWFIAIIVLAFGIWDAYADPAHWQAAFQVRMLGAAVVMGTGLFQKMPGKIHWLPLMAKIRMIVAVITALVAAMMLDRGYGFAVAGAAAIILTGPYIAIDVRDLLATNLILAGALGAVMVAVSLDPFDAIGTAVFVLLAVASSLLLGRVVEASHRREFVLELELRRDARTDALTGLDNRRAMEERGPIELKRAQRSGTPVSVILCDVDHFKSINDRYGHVGGDTVLRTVATKLRAALRETDLLGRWGGEEFMAVLVDTDSMVARHVAERMRSAVATTTFEGLPEGTTISLGVATQHTVVTASSAWDMLIKEADQLLYQAKKEGRNRVIYTQA